MPYHTKTRVLSLDVKTRVDMHVPRTLKIPYHDIQWHNKPKLIIWAYTKVVRHVPRFLKNPTIPYETISYRVWWAAHSSNIQPQTITTTSHHTSHHSSHHPKLNVWTGFCNKPKYITCDYKPWPNYPPGQGPGWDSSWKLTFHTNIISGGRGTNKSGYGLLWSLVIYDLNTFLCWNCFRNYTIESWFEI